MQDIFSAVDDSSQEPRHNSANDKSPDQIREELEVPIAFLRHTKDVGEHGFHLGINHSIPWMRVGGY